MISRTSLTAQRPPGVLALKGRMRACSSSGQEKEYGWMIDLSALQKRVYQNKVNHGFNTTNIPLEFTLTYGELAEAFEAWRKKK